MRSERLDALPGHDLDGGYRVAVASTRRARMKGLGGLDALPPDRALHLPKCRSIHTFTMRFALDLIWLRADGSVARIDRGVGPHRMRLCLRARSVVECPAGAADAFLGAGLEGLALI